MFNYKKLKRVSTFEKPLSYQFYKRTKLWKRHNDWPLGNDGIFDYLAI